MVAYVDHSRQADLIFLESNLVQHRLNESSMYMYIWLRDALRAHRLQSSENQKAL